VMCEGLWYDLPLAPMNYACKWDERTVGSWRSYSSFLDFGRGRWRLTEKPATDAPINPASIEERQLRAWLIPHLRREIVEVEVQHKLTVRYAYALLDLNDDGRDEAIVLLTGEQVCGSGGCPIEVETPRNGRWSALSEIVMTSPPIQVLPTKHHGWRDIAVWNIKGQFESAVRFMGRQYDGAPSDEPLPKHLHGRTVIDFPKDYRPLF